MTCPNCDSQLVSFDVPPELREYVPDTQPSLAICSQCLSLHPTDQDSDSNPDPETRTETETDYAPDFGRISGSFPTDEAAVPMALVLGLLESLALHRTEIESLLERVEQSGVDPLLVIDRLARQGSVHPQWDVNRRRHQLEQFLD